jgi:hypothetical protein
MRGAALAPVLAGALLAVLVGVRLASALPEVPNRHALNWDAARRVMLDVEAADTLRTGDLGGYLGYLAGPETWPTLRLAIAAPLHALAGVARALQAEYALSLVTTAALFLALGFAARSMAPGPGSALLVLAVATAVLAGNRPLLVYGADAMLEVPSALLTLLAAAAWIASRQAARSRPWGVAVLGNLLFHVKWQHGMIFAAAAIGLEAWEAGALRCTRVVGAALVRCARSRPGAALLCVLAVHASLAAWVMLSGGGEGRLLGLPIAVRRLQGPVAFGALTMFAYLELALWRAREGLREEIPERVRFLWVWLATPMAAWLLVPFTWRLRTLVHTSFDYVSGEAPPGLAARLLFYPKASLSWAPAGLSGLLLALLAATLVAAWLSPGTRRRVVPLAVLGGAELVTLVLLNHRNYQARFILNLAPLAALWAAAWTPAVARPVLRAGLALGVAAAFAGGAAPGWERPALAATLSQGFVATETGDACRALARALPLEHGVLVNRTSLSQRQACALWVKLVARERGTDVDVYGAWPRPRWEQALVLAEGCASVEAPEGLLPDGAEVESGPLCGRRYRLAGR